MNLKHVTNHHHQKVVEEWLYFLCFRWWWIKQLNLFKLNIVLNKACPSCNIHQLVCFCIFCISQQNAFATLGLEGLPLVNGYFGPSFGTKNSQVGDIGLIPMQCFEWSGPNHMLVRHSILQIQSTVYYFSPKRRM